MRVLVLFPFIFGMTLREHMRLENIKYNKIENHDNIQIAKNWYEGDFLIYHCKKKLLMCVNFPGMKRCDTLRRKKKRWRDGDLGCVPLKRMKNRGQCYKMQKKYSNTRKILSLCQLP